MVLVQSYLDSFQRIKTPLYCPHTPTYKQLLALALNPKEAFYGGAAGGGKSDYLLMAASQYLDVPGYSALLLRTTFKALTLPGALLDRSKMWWTGKANWSEKLGAWSFSTSVPSMPARIFFGYLEHDKDVEQYQSMEVQFVGFDELTQFSEFRYKYMHSRTRRPKCPFHKKYTEGCPECEKVKYLARVPIRVRSASNPGNLGHKWVKQRFITEGKEFNRPFIPAKLADNPFLDQAEYIESLNNLDPLTRQRLLDGDWDAQITGKMFKREYFEIVDAAPTQAKRVRCWDMAATEEDENKDPDWTVGLLMSRDIDGMYYIEDVRRDRLEPFATEKLIKQTAALDGKKVTIRMEQEPGSSGKTVIAQYTRTLAGWMFKGEPSTGDKVVRAGPVATQAGAGNIKLVRGPWIGAFLDEIELFPKKGVHDDQVDALSGAFEELTSSNSYDSWEEFLKNRTPKKEEESKD